MCCAPASKLALPAPSAAHLHCHAAIGARPVFDVLLQMLPAIEAVSGQQQVPAAALPWIVAKFGDREANQAIISTYGPKLHFPPQEPCEKILRRIATAAMSEGTFNLPQDFGPCVGDSLRWNWMEDRCRIR